MRTTTARMLGKTRRPLACHYGCCVPDFGRSHRSRRAVIRSARAAEKAQLRKELVSA